MAYFILMNVTVERYYCEGPLEAGDTRFLVAETLDFCSKYNPLFLERPPFLHIATCISAYVFCPFYFLILIAAVTDSWARFQVPITLFVGAKANAIIYYHIMEFTSHNPPQDVIPYFGGMFVHSFMDLFPTTSHHTTHAHLSLSLSLSLSLLG